MTSGFKTFTVKIHATPFSQEHPFNTQDYVVLWNGDMPCNELTQQDSRLDGQRFLCEKHDRAITCTFCCAGLLQKDLFKGRQRLAKRHFKHLLPRLSQLGLPSSFICHPFG